MIKFQVRHHAQILLVLILCFCNTSSISAQEKAARISPAETWLRQVFQSKGSLSTDLQLRVSAPGVNTVYFNGQRLLRNTTVEGVVAWKVGSLLRDGANCVSIAVGKSDEPRQIAASMSIPQGEDITLHSWNATLDTPPVGWHKTDFNDRDWKPVPPAPAAEIFRTADATMLSWIATDNSSHINGDHLKFRDGDHVVLLGGTFIERAQQFGHLEAALTSAAGAASVTFRNLGWSADTVFADSRGIFDTPAKGYERMIEQVRAEEPTLILVCYGQNEAMSFAQDAAGVDRFRNQLRVLHGDLSTAGAEVVFLTPHPFVSLAPPLPDASRWNARLAIFADAVKDVAEDLGAVAINLNRDFVTDLASSAPHHYGDTGSSPQSDRRELSFGDSHPEIDAIRNSMWTDNGMHWNEAGYKLVASLVASRLLGWTERSWPDFSIDIDNRELSGRLTELKKPKWDSGNEGGVTFQFRQNQIFATPILVKCRAALHAKPQFSVELSGQAGAFTCVAEDGNGNALYVAQRTTDYEQLRQLVIDKNELYFHRWRPQNITYLFGFRKHEQGNNASDIAKFDPLIEDLERKIQEAKKPRWRTMTVKLLSK